MTESSLKFKSKHPDYYKQYYIKNRDTFVARNKNRASKRKYYYVLELNGNKYCFHHKKDVPLQKTEIHNIEQEGYTLIKTD